MSIKEALMSLLDGSDADETFLQKWYGNVYCCCDQSGTSRDMGALQSVALSCVRTVNYVELHSWALVKKSCACQACRTNSGGKGISIFTSLPFGSFVRSVLQNIDG